MTATQTQALEALCADAPWYEKLIVKHRRLMGVAIPFTFFQVIWWSCAVKYNFWRLFPDRFFMSITMIFGSMIAGKKEVILRIETLEIFSTEIFGIYCKPQTAILFPETLKISLGFASGNIAGLGETKLTPYFGTSH